MTTLNLLTREGLVTAIFDPPLRDHHYTELYGIVCGAETADEMRRGLEAWAKAAGLRLSLR